MQREQQIHLRYRVYLDNLIYEVEDESEKELDQDEWIIYGSHKFLESPIYKIKTRYYLNCFYFYNF